ncbi:MAG: hypothetical protein LBG78_04195, partial [Azoarcus sp.]|nr:hypothetical protein [Azoarcus sp.]
EQTRALADYIETCQQQLLDTTSAVSAIGEQYTDISKKVSDQVEKLSAQFENSQQQHTALMQFIDDNKRQYGEVLTSVLAQTDSLIQLVADNRQHVEDNRASLLAHDKAMGRHIEASQKQYSDISSVVLAQNEVLKESVENIQQQYAEISTALEHFMENNTHQYQDVSSAVRTQTDTLSRQVESSHQQFTEAMDSIKAQTDLSVSAIANLGVQQGLLTDVHQDLKQHISLAQDQFQKMAHMLAEQIESGKQWHTEMAKQAQELQTGLSDKTAQQAKELEKHIQKSQDVFAELKTAIVSHSEIAAMLLELKKEVSAQQRAGKSGDMSNDNKKRFDDISKVLINQNDALAQIIEADRRHQEEMAAMFQELAGYNQTRSAEEQKILRASYGQLANIKQTLDKIRQGFEGQADAS